MAFAQYTRTTEHASDVDTAQAASNRPLAIFTLASSSVRAVNLRTRPVALCRTVHMIGGPFSAACVKKIAALCRRGYRTLQPFATRVPTQRMRLAWHPRKPKPRGPSPRDRTLTRNGPTCPDCDRRISPNSFSSFSRAAKSAADGATAGEPETAPSAGESGFGLSSGKSRAYLLVSSMSLSFTSNPVPREGRSGGACKSSASCLIPPNFPASVALWTWYLVDSSE